MTDTAEILDIDTTQNKTPVSVNGVKAEELQRIIDRIERLEEDKKGIAEDIKAVKGEAKSDGFDIKTITEILKLRKKDAHTIEEEEMMIEVYKRALGMS